MKVFIGLAAPNGGFVPFGWLIQLVEKRNYDHCYIRFQEPTGEWMIFQASGFAVNMYNVDVWLGKNKSIKEYEVDITKAQSTKIWKFVKANLGIPYSLKEDFGILLMKIFKLKKNPYNAGMSAEFCAQLDANVCKLLGIEIPEESSAVDPSGLDKILSSEGFKCVLNPQIKD